MFPKIIHQTWKNNNIPKKWQLSQTQWKKLHPDYEYILWTDADIRNYIKEKHPSFLKLHDSYEYNIQRADMIRYFILYDFGGIYSDLDLYPVENIEKYISNYDESVDVLLVNSGNVKNCITNSFMVSKKNAPLWKKVQKRLKQKLPIYIYGKHLKVMYSTGPLMFTKICKKNEDVFQLLPQEKFMAYSSNDDFSVIKKDAVLIPLKGQSWNAWDSKVYNYVNKNVKTVTKIVKRTKYKNKLRMSFMDNLKNQTTLKYEFKPLNFEYLKKNTSNLNYVHPEYMDDVITIKFNHTDCDGVKVICDVCNITQKFYDDQLLNDFTLFVVAPLKSLHLLSKQLKIHSSKPAVMNTNKNKKLNYSNLNVSLKKIKTKMKDSDCNHTTSFLFALHVYTYAKSTNVNKVKVSKFYYIPWVIGNNKFMKYYMNIHIPEKNTFKSIYDQIVSKNINTMDAWGIYYWINYFNIKLKDNTMFNYMFEKNINSEKNNYGEDVAFSNLPMSIPCEYIKILYKSNQKEVSYSSSYGLSDKNISISLVNHDIDSLKNFDKLYIECLNSLHQ